MRTNKRTTMLRSFTAAFALAVGMFTGFAQTTGSDAGTSWLDNQYIWIEPQENGPSIEHKATYRETAKNPYQMKALIGSVYADPTVPGQISVIGEDYSDNNKEKSPIEYTIDKNSNLYTNYKDFSGKVRDLNFGSSNSVTVTPKEGLTVLLVEMKDDYNPDEDKTEDFTTSFEHIKAISVLPATHQHYMKTGSDNADAYTSGYLVNIKQDLGKFFLLLKGDIYDRTSKYEKAPFYSYFEQIAPVSSSNSSTATYVQNAYELMTDPVKMEEAGSQGKFYVDHNCVSVLNTGHAMMMYSKKDVKTVTANMFIYIPDGRFYKGGNTSNKYNYYYSKTSGKNAKGDFRPYVFVPQLTLKAEYANSDAQHNATINVDWTSTLKSITKDVETERYRLLRSDNGVNGWTEVPAKDITVIVTQGPTKDAENGHISWNGQTKDGQTVTGQKIEIKVREDQYTTSRTVYYQVFDKLALEDTNFDETESNVVSVVIPGYEITNPTLNITLEHKSEFDYSNTNALKNHYANLVKFVLSEKDEDGLKNETIGDEGLELRLYRFENIGRDVMTEEKGLKIATINIVRKDGTTNRYSVTLTNESNQQVTDLGELTATDSGTKLEQLHKAGASYKGGDEWGRFVDNFDYNITGKDQADGTTYSYRLFTTNAKNVVILDDNRTPTPNILSNVCDATMPAMGHGCGFIDYSLDEIKGDLQHTLEPSVPQFIFTPLSTADDLRECKIMSADSIMATASKTNQGYWTLVSTYEKKQNSNTGGMSSVRAKANPSVMGKESFMEITRGENTYGTPLRTMPYLPQLRISGLKLNYEASNYGYTDELTMQILFHSQADNNHKFASHGYGVWNLNLDQAKEANESEIRTLTHHKHGVENKEENFDLDNVNFNYTNGKNTAANHMGYSLEGGNADSKLSYFHEHERGSKQTPYAMWYLARYYAQYNPNATPESGAQRVAAETNPDQRYVVLQALAGARNEGGNATTGVEDIAVDGNAVYPHVTDDIINITVPGAVEVFSVNGEEVAALPDEGHEGTDRTISLGHLNSGLYIVVVNGVSYKVVRR